MPFTAHEIGSAAMYPLGPAGPNANGYKYVDLGLPSGRLWATCNIGASRPEEYGLYFQWASTVGYPDASVCSFDENGDAPYYKGPQHNMQLLKYNGLAQFGPVDHLSELESEDNAAHVIMKGDWTIPSNADYEELVDNTSKSFDTVNGINGMRLSGSNGNSIFLPFTGEYINGQLTCSGTEEFMYTRFVCRDCSPAPFNNYWTFWLDISDPDFLVPEPGNGCTVRATGNPIRAVI